MTAAAARLALAALTPVLADAATAALFAKVAPPPVRTTGRHIRPDTARLLCVCLREGGVCKHGRRFQTRGKNANGT